MKRTYVVLWDRTNTWDDTGGIAYLLLGEYEATTAAAARLLAARDRGFGGDDATLIAVPKTYWRPAQDWIAQPTLGLAQV